MYGDPFVVAPRAMVRGSSGRYLFLQRSAASKHFAGQWEMPGGKMDPGETLEDCVLRETLEEAGLAVHLERVFGAAEGRIEGLRLAYIILEAHATTEEVLLSDEHSAFCWVSISEARQLDLVPAFKTFVESLALKENS